MESLRRQPRWVSVLSLLAHFLLDNVACAGRERTGAEVTGDHEVIARREIPGREVGLPAIIEAFGAPGPSRVIAASLYKLDCASRRFETAGY